MTTLSGLNESIVNLVLPITRIYKEYRIHNMAFCDKVEIHFEDDNDCTRFSLQYNLFFFESVSMN